MALLHSSEAMFVGKGKFPTYFCATCSSPPEADRADALGNDLSVISINYPYILYAIIMETYKYHCFIGSKIWKWHSEADWWSTAIIHCAH